MLVIWTVGCMVALVAGKGLPTNYLPLQGYQIWEVSELSQDVLQTMESDGLIDILDHSTGHTIGVTPLNMNTVSRILEEHKIDKVVVVQDLADFLKVQDEKDQKLNVRSQTCTASDCQAPLLDDYMTFQQMEYYLDHISQAFPDRVTVTSIGKTYENRDIWLVHIKSGACNTDENTRKSCKAPKQKPKAIWLEGGIHGREWITPAVALYMIYRSLLDCATTKNYDIYVAPIVNPDGYEYSRTTDRFWRKTRSPNLGSECRGVDLNRNWGYKWGASSNPCSSSYRGESEFSEPETIALRDAMKEIKDLELYLSFHSFGQALLLPWGWTKNISVINSLPDKEEMEHLADVFVANIQARHGEDYYHANLATGYYVAMGNSADWAKGSLGVKYAYTLELRDVRYYRFELPRGEILPTGQEVWNGLKMVMTELNPSGKGCSKPTISCTLAGGSCIRRGEDCDGIIDPNGCKGRCCLCCITKKKCQDTAVKVGGKCIFPFLDFQGVERNECIPADHPHPPICAVALNEDKTIKKYDLCENTSTFTKGCIFPFIYKGVKYRGCAPGIAQPHPWCATSVNYDRTMKTWDICYEI